MENKKIYVEDLVKILFSQTRISIENEWYKTLYDDKILTQQILCFGKWPYRNTSKGGIKMDLLEEMQENTKKMKNIMYHQENMLYFVIVASYLYCRVIVKRNGGKWKYIF